MIQKIQEKWTKKWAKAKIFEANPDKRKKFFATFPYPYINLYPHIGHFFSVMKVEASARYKRMQGYNVLYPQAWHVTGSPMANAARRVQEGEKKQIQILKDMGFTKDEIPSFKEPMHWIKVFSKGWREDLSNAGLSIDWRRNFITTDLNKSYDAFIRWQFRTLKKRGYVTKGKHPVIWCTKDNSPVGDHSRIKGEGETPQEFTALKLKAVEKIKGYKDVFLICATLRPETSFGQTNIWIDPSVNYILTRVKYTQNKKYDETWLINEYAFNIIQHQEKTAEKLATIHGKELVGVSVYSSLGIKGDKNAKLPVLPAEFIDGSKGTGVVVSVPSDAPDDYVALRDLQSDPKLRNKYNVPEKLVMDVKVIPIIKTQGLGEIPGVDIVNKLKIKNQHDRNNLEKAKKIVYKKGFHTGIMNENCAQYKGLPVDKAKEKIKKYMLEKGLASKIHEPTGEVVCRCLTPSIVKIVEDQWFITYGNKKWKKTAHKCLDKMMLHPEKSRTQFDYVIDWLNDWACTREFGLGTNLPWEEKWKIESLSDSTIYMAYYTIAHRIKNIPVENLDDNFFDYVFLGKKKKLKVSQNLADELKNEFEYWYPMDYRNSGKDLIQNHLTFSIFVHTAVFPEKHWPQSFGVNGWVTVDGQKMSKSLGNVIPVRKMNSEFGADASRFTVLSGGEGIDDANWDTDLAKSMSEKLSLLIDFAKKQYNKGVYEKKTIENWIESKINELVKETTSLMEGNLFRSALQKSYFEFERVKKWYMRRTEPNKEVMKKIIETQALLLAPIAPFTCEEIWEIIGKKGFISVADWPRPGKVDKKLDVLESTIQGTLEDLHSVLKLTKIKKPKKIQLFVADKWKYGLHKLLKKEKSRDFRKIMSKVMKNNEFKKHSKDVSKMIQRALKQGLDEISNQDNEFTALNESRDFFTKEFKAEIEVIKAEDSKEGKARQALPGKPAILVE